MATLMTPGQAKQIKRFAEDALDSLQDMTVEEAQRVIESGDRFQIAIKKAVIQLGQEVEYYEIDVRSVDSMELLQQGKYDSFPVKLLQRKYVAGDYILGKTRVYIVRLSPQEHGKQTVYEYSPSEVVSALSDLGFIPANIVQLIVFGNTYSTFLCKKLVALGTSFDGDSFYLHNFTGRKIGSIGYAGYKFHCNATDFLAVRP